MGEVFKIDGFSLDGGRVEARAASGERYSLTLQPSDVHSAEELATYLAGYKPFDFRADEASPPILTEKRSDKYRTFSADDAFRVVEVKAATQAEVPEVDVSSSLSTYTVVERALGAFIPREVEAEAGANYDVRAVHGRKVMNKILLDRENDVWTLLETSANWDTSVRTALTGTNNWNGGATSTPIEDLQTAIEKSWQPVTDIWMNEKIVHTFLRNDSVRDHMRQMLGDTAPQFASGAISRQRDILIPGLPPIHMSQAKKKNESTGALEYILGDVVVLITKPPGEPTNGEEIASSYTFRHRGESGTGIDTREFIVENRGTRGGTMIVVAMAEKEYLTGTKVGGIISGVIS